MSTGWFNWVCAASSITFIVLYPLVNVQYILHSVALLDLIRKWNVMIRTAYHWSRDLLCLIFLVKPSQLQKMKHVQLLGGRVFRNGISSSSGEGADCIGLVSRTESRVGQVLVTCVFSGRIISRGVLFDRYVIKHNIES